MTEQITLSSFSLVWFSVIILFWTLNIATRQFIDTFKSKKDIKKPARKVQPLITVIVITHNNQTTIEHSLDSIYNSSIKKFNVVVIDNKSSDETARLVRAYKKGRALTIIQKRKHVHTLDIHEIFAHPSVKGEIIAVISGSQTFSRHSLRLIREKFDQQADLGRLDLHASNVFQPQITPLINMFNEIVSRPSNSKNHSIHELAYAVKTTILTDGNYRTETITRASITNIAPGWRTTLQRLSYTAKDQLAYGIFGLSVLACMIYGFYVSNLLFFLIPWGAATILYIILLISNDNLDVITKLRLSFYSPIAYVFTMFFASMWLYGEIKSLSAVKQFTLSGHRKNQRKLSPLLIKL